MKTNYIKTDVTQQKKETNWDLNLDSIEIKDSDEQIEEDDSYYWSEDDEAENGFKE